MKNKLIILTGLPRSGKSTWACEALKNSPKQLTRVCVDDIRKTFHGQRFIPEAENMVWSVAKYTVKSLLLSGNNVMLDATNINEAAVAWALSYVNSPKTPDIEIRVLVFGTDPDVCIERAVSTDQEDLVPVINTMVLQREMWWLDSCLKKDTELACDESGKTVLSPKRIGELLR